MRSAGHGRSPVRALGLVVGAAFRADPWRAGLACLLTPLLALATTGSGLWLKLLVDAAAEQRPVRALAAGVGLAATVSLINVAGLALATLRFRLQERTGLLLERRLVQAAASLPGLEHHERPDYLDRLEHLRAERPTLSQAPGMVVTAVAAVLQAAATAALLGGVHPALLLLPLAGVPPLLAAARAAAVMDQARHATAPLVRLADHHLRLATSPGPAKELRLFGAGGLIIRRHQRLGRAVARRRARARLNGAAWEAAGSLPFVAACVGAVALVLWRAAAGAATPGDVILTVRLASQVNGSVLSLADAAGRLREVLLLAGHFRWLVHVPRAGGEDRPRLPPPDRLRRGITLQDVRFRYPGGGADILRGVNLHLPAGSVVALVGENGAGKSTMVKLVCGFYRPTAGRILVDGADLADLADEAWQARLSGAFQDFARLEFSAQEAIGVGDLDAIADQGRVHAAAEQAGAGPVLAALPDGLATQLGTTFQGTDLSHGQWQRLALARSRMPPRPLLYVLDEPTASLDAGSEHVLFSRIARSARQAAGNGAITLLVSHRLSTVRDADLIVVLEDGQVAEVGTHAELMAAAGSYAELFTLQATAYR